VSHVWTVSGKPDSNSRTGGGFLGEAGRPLCNKSGCCCISRHDSIKMAFTMAFTGIGFCHHDACLPACLPSESNIHSLSVCKAVPSMNNQNTFTFDRLQLTHRSLSSPFAVCCLLFAAFVLCNYRAFFLGFHVCLSLYNFVAVLDHRLGHLSKSGTKLIAIDAIYTQQYQYYVTVLRVTILEYNM
jgi:hypothetical protein